MAVPDIIVETLDVDGVLSRVVKNEPYNIEDKQTGRIQKGTYSMISFIPEKRGDVSRPSNIKVKSESLIEQLDQLADQVGRRFRFSCSLVSGFRGNLELHLLKASVIK